MQGVTVHWTVTRGGAPGKLQDDKKPYKPISKPFGYILDKKYSSKKGAASCRCIQGHEIEQSYSGCMSNKKHPLRMISQGMLLLFRIRETPIKSLPKQSTGLFRISVLFPAIVVNALST